MGWLIVIFLVVGNWLFSFGLVSISANLIYRILLIAAGLALLVYSQILLFRHITKRQQNILYGKVIVSLLGVSLIINTIIFVIKDAIQPASVLLALTSISTLIWWGMFITLLVYLYKSRIKKPAIGYSTPSYTSGYNVTKKTCSACGREVPVTSQAGQRCPHCGIYWGTESKKYI